MMVYHSPKDGTLIKGDKSQAIYVITKGLKVGLDAKTWTSKYKSKTKCFVSSRGRSYPAPS